MKYLSICSGIEAATVAFHSLGWTPLAFAEIEAFPSAVLAHHYPDIPNLGDMTKYREWPVEILAECDLLVGGPPCQAFSVAGLRNSLDDERGNLTLTYVHLIDHIDSIRKKHGRDPIISIYENVPGIYSTRDNAFGCLVGAICGQDADVETETGKWPTTGIFWGKKRRVGYRTLDAQFFGVAQRRRRVFVIAVPNQLVERIGERADPAEILSIPESLRGDSAPRREAREGASPRSGKSPFYRCPCGYRFEYELGAYGCPNCDGENRATLIDVPDIVPQAMSSKWSKGSSGPAGDEVANTVTHSLRGEGFDASEDGTGRVTPLVPVAFHPTQDPISSADGTTHAMGCGSKNGQATVAVATPLGVRRLTVVECARLQGFPDDYLLQVIWRGKSPPPDGPMYKALGNSMAVPCMAWIGRQIDRSLT